MIIIDVAKSELTDLDKSIPDVHILRGKFLVPGGVTVLFNTQTISSPNPDVGNRPFLFAESQMTPRSRVLVACFSLAQSHDTSELHKTVAELDVVRIAALHKQNMPSEHEMTNNTPQPNHLPGLFIACLVQKKRTGPNASFQRPQPLTLPCTSRSVS